MILTRSCWYGNKYIRGAYSYRSLNFYSSDSNLEDLQSALYINYKNEDGNFFEVPIYIYIFLICTELVVLKSVYIYVLYIWGGEEKVIITCP